VTPRDFLQAGAVGVLSMIGASSSDMQGSGRGAPGSEKPVKKVTCLAAPVSIENETVRVAMVALEGRWGLEFAVKRADRSWRPVLATAATTDAPWKSKQRLVSEDPQITWKQDGHEFQNKGRQELETGLVSQL